MSGKLHDGLDAHGMIGQGGDEASAATVTGRPLDACLSIYAVDQLAEGVCAKATLLSIGFLAHQHGIGLVLGGVRLQVGCHFLPQLAIGVDHTTLAALGLLAAQAPLLQHGSCWSQHLVTGEGSNLTDPHACPVTEEQSEPVSVCVPPSCDDRQSPLQFLLGEHFRLRHSPNPSFDKRNITFARFWWATGNGGQGG